MNWREKMNEEPIPPAAISAALSELVQTGVIKRAPTGPENKGRGWLAEQLGVRPETVYFWIKGVNKCKGLSARAVRHFFSQY
jgi:hypothetical protein